MLLSTSAFKFNLRRYITEVMKKEEVESWNKLRVGGFEHLPQ